MKMIKHETNNAVLVGTKDGVVQDASVTMAYDPSSRSAVVITFWQPSEEDLANLLAGQPLAICSLGQTIPPTRLCVYTTKEALFGA